MPDYCLMYTSLPDEAAAKALANQLVMNKAAACVSLLPAVHSCYRWEGSIQEGTEYLLMIKTQYSAYSRCETLIKELHPYELPEVIQVPIENGCPNYLAWIKHETE